VYPFFVSEFLVDIWSTNQYKVNYFLHLWKCTGGGTGYLTGLLHCLETEALFQSMLERGSLITSPKFGAWPPRGRRFLSGASPFSRPALNVSESFDPWHDFELPYQPGSCHFFTGRGFSAMDSSLS